MNYLVNAFSLNMVELSETAFMRVRRVSPKDIPQDITSAIGHTDTAQLVSGILGREVPANRITVSLTHDDVAYVAQYKGPRLQEGATTLPEGASISFFEVTLRGGCQGCQSQDCNSCSQMDWLHG